ncbi:MAG: hypothetical protein ACRCTX_14975, partial [Afipia sp.]
SFFNLPPQSLIARNSQGLPHLRDGIDLSEKGLHFRNQIGGNLFVPSRCRRLDDALNLGEMCAVERSHGSPRNVTSHPDQSRQPIGDQRVI